MINPHNPDFTLHPAHPARHVPDHQLLAWNDTLELTIVTPFYNTGAVFYETARSILNQSLQQWEWLIINDGSNEEPALKILEEFRHRDPRIRVIDHSENRGLSAARNSGFAHARCEIVLLLDSDDLLEPTAAEKWWWFLHTHPEYGFAASYHIAFGGLNFLWTGGFHDGALNAERNRVSMMCVLRKSVYQAAGGFDESIRGGLEDWDFWMRCASLGYWGGNIPEYLAWYRYRGDHSDRWQNLQETKLDEFRTILKNKYPQLYNGEFPSITETVDYDLTTIDLEIPAFNRLAKTKPHLLLVLPWLVMGGAERFMLSLIEQLTARGWLISVVTTMLSENPWLYEFEKRTPSVYVLPNFIKIKDYPRFLGYLVGSRDFDAILMQGSMEGYRLTPFLRGLFPNIPILDYLHFVTPDWMKGGFPKLSLLYRDFIDFTFTTCQQVRDWMIDAGAIAEHVTICYIGADTDTWKPDSALRAQVRADLGIGENDIVILYAARLEEQKQPGVLAKTLCRLSEKGDKFHAIVAGEGTLLESLKAELQACALQDCVHILGGVPAGKMPAIMASADIFFLPSQNEGISQALYEAMACGLVVVSANVGGQAELVTSDCGVLLTPAINQDEAAQYSEILHNLICDTPRRHEMSLTSRNRVVEKFNLSLMGSCVHNNLLKVIEGKKNNTEASNPVPEIGTIEREIRTLVEYLQVRQRQRWLEHEYSVLVTPRSPSHWFYLWIRQELLPLYNWIARTKLERPLSGLKQAIKRRLVRDA